MDMVNEVLGNLEEKKKSRNYNLHDVSMSRDSHLNSEYTSTEVGIP